MINEIPSVRVQPQISFGMKSSYQAQCERVLNEMERELNLAKRGPAEVREIIVRDSALNFAGIVKGLMSKIGIKF